MPWIDGNVWQNHNGAASNKTRQQREGISCSGLVHRKSCLKFYLVWQLRRAIFRLCLIVLSVLGIHKILIKGVIHPIQGPPHADSG